MASDLALEMAHHWETMLEFQMVKHSGTGMEAKKGYLKVSGLALM